jgi:hypothetical protein
MRPANRLWRGGRMFTSRIDHLQKLIEGTSILTAPSVAAAGPESRGAWYRRNWPPPIAPTDNEAYRINRENEPGE